MSFNTPDSAEAHSSPIEHCFSRGGKVKRQRADELTELLQEWRGGDRAALDSLLPIVYRELLRLAHFQMRQERPEHTLQSSALVHETYMRLVGLNPPNWESRTHFFAIAAQLMRQILVDHARRYRSGKRGGGVEVLSLEDSDVSEFGTDKGPDIVAIDDALQSLSKIDDRKARVVEMRFFGGLNFEEIAEVLKVSAATVARDWSTARAWLHREISRSKPDSAFDH